MKICLFSSSVEVRFLNVLPCVILFMCFSVHLALRFHRLGKVVRLFDLRLFGFVCFLFLLVSGRDAACDCGTLWTFLLHFFHAVGFLQLELVFLRHTQSFHAYGSKIVDNTISNGLYLQ